MCSVSGGKEKDLRRRRGSELLGSAAAAAGPARQHPRRAGAGQRLFGDKPLENGVFPAAGTWGCWCRTTAPGEPRGRAEPGGGSGAQRIPQRAPPPPPGEGCAGRLRGAAGRGGIGDGAPGHRESRGDRHSEVRTPEGGRNGATKCGYGGEKMPGDMG